MRLLREPVNPLQSPPIISDAPLEYHEISSRNHYGQCARSKNGLFLLTWADVPACGRYFLLSGNQICAEGRMSGPNDGKVADNGTFILNQWGHGNGLKGSFRAFDCTGEVILSKHISANPFNNGLSPDGRYAAFQACNAPGSREDGVLILFDLVAKGEIGRFVPATGWADDYRFHEDGTVQLGYRKLGRFRYAFSGEFLDRGAYEEAQLMRGDYSMALITVERIMKEHRENLPIELNERLLNAIDRAERQIVPDDMKTFGMAKKLRGACLEARGQIGSALRCYQDALAIDPKAGVKRSIHRLTKATRD